MGMILVLCDDMKDRMDRRQGYREQGLIQNQKDQRKGHLN